MHCPNGSCTTQKMQCTSVVHVAVELRVKDQLHKSLVQRVRPKAMHVVHGQVQPAQRPRPMPITPVMLSGARLHRDDRDETGLNLESQILEGMLPTNGPKQTFKNTLGQPRESNKSSQCFPAFFQNPIRLAQEADSAQLIHAWAQHRIFPASVVPPCKHLHFIGRRSHGWWHQRHYVQRPEIGVRRPSMAESRRTGEVNSDFYVSHLNCVFKEFMSMSEKKSSLSR